MDYHLSDNSANLPQTQVPSSIKNSNLLIEKKYETAILEGLRQLRNHPENASIHVNLMDAYFKAREIDSTYLDKSSYHAKMAILNGHHTGYAEDRLAKNLDKQKKYHQTIQLCNLVLREDFHFSPHGCGNTIDFSARKEKAQQKINKASDDESCSLFTPTEIEKIINDIKNTDIKKAKLKEEYAILEKKCEQAFNKAERTDNFSEVDKIMRRMSEISSQIIY